MPYWSRIVTTAHPNVDFIRLFFPSPSEEPVAVHWAQVLASMIGEQVMMLRPDTTWGEIFTWIEAVDDDDVKLALELAEMQWFDSDTEPTVDDLEQMTFREFVEYATTWCRIDR